MAVACHPVSCERSLGAGPAWALRHLPQHPPPHCAQAHLRLDWPWGGTKGSGPSPALPAGPPRDPLCGLAPLTKVICHPLSSLLPLLSPLLSPPAPLVSTASLSMSTPGDPRPWLDLFPPGAPPECCSLGWGGVGAGGHCGLRPRAGQSIWACVPPSGPRGLCKRQWVALVTRVLALALALPPPSWLIGHLPPQGPPDPQAWARAHGHKQPAVTRSHTHISHGVGKAASSGSQLDGSGTPGSFSA